MTTATPALPSDGQSGLAFPGILVLGRYPAAERLEEAVPVQLVSKVITTAGGCEVWVEMQGSDDHHLRCSGCGADETFIGVAPALFALGNHAKSCQVR